MTVLALPLASAGVHGDISGAGGGDEVARVRYGLHHARLSGDSRDFVRAVRALRSAAARGPRLPGSPPPAARQPDTGALRRELAALVASSVPCDRRHRLAIHPGADGLMARPPERNLAAEPMSECLRRVALLLRAS